MGKTQVNKTLGKTMFIKVGGRRGKIPICCGNYRFYNSGL
jgi:hypothetical protein